MTYTTVDGRRTRGGMAFDSFSHAKNGSYLTKGGSMISRKDWPRFKGAFDDVSATPASSGEPKKPMNPLATTAKGKLRSALKAFCDATGLEHEEVADQLDELLDGHERERVRAHAASLGVGAGEGAGAGALDDDEDDDASVERRVRELLASKGLDDEAIEEALKRVRADREEAKDRLPLNGLYGTGGRTSRGPSGSRSEYEPPDSVTEADIYGEPNSQRLMRDADPVRAEAERVASRLPGGSAGARRYANASDAALATDAEAVELELERDYGNAGPRVGVFGR
jgi:hypothetical protein